MSNYVKKYDVGQIQLDLPTSNYIHELPLLSFSDIYGGVNLSLVFNYQGKLENSNAFYISAGYKLNLQKRLIIVGTSIKLQEATGKIVELNKFGDRYTFEDDSQRIMRKKSCTYIIENPDYSREEYNSAGRLTEVYDKYGTINFKYQYTAAGLLDYVIYRNNKTIDFKYESNRLESIAYGGTTTTFTYDDTNNIVTVNHYSGVVYTLKLNEMNFEVIANGNEGVTYSTKLVKQEDNTTLSIQNCINDDVVDTTLYKYPEYLEYFDPGYRFHQVEVTNNNGVKTRVQYGYDKIECSYEINGTNDVEFCNNAYPSNVNIYNIEDKTRMNPFNGVHTFNDGVALHCTNESNQRWQVDVSMDGNTSLRGYYVLTGWIKRTAEPYADNTICISNHTAGPVETFYASATPLNEWKFFAYKFSLSANFIYVYPSCPVGIELKDVKLTFKTTHLLEENSTSYIPIIDNVLVHKTTNKIIPLIKSKFVCGDVEFAEEGYVTFNDILKYKINKKKNINADEFYSNNLKNVHTINSASSINVIYDDVEYDLSNCYLGKMNYANQGNIVTQIVDDESNIAFYTYCDTNLRDNFDGVLLSVKKYNTNMDVVHEEKDDVAVVYERDGAGLVTKETVGSIVREFVYENGKLKETTDEFGYTTTYETDDTWGVITSIILPDGSVITDEFDGDKSTLKKRVFEKTTRRANEMLYSKGQLSQLKTSGLVYDFNYSEGKLSNIKKNNSYVEEHFQSNTKIDSYYPHEASNIYQQTMNFDKYGRLISIAGELEYNYALSSLWYDKNGKTYSGIDGETYTLFDGGKFNHSSWGGNSDGAKLSTSTDLITGQKTKYGYYQNRLVGIETHDSSDNVVSKEYYTYDKANRVKKITHS